MSKIQPPQPKTTAVAKANAAINNGIKTAAAIAPLVAQLKPLKISAIKHQEINNAIN